VGGRTSGSVTFQNIPAPGNYYVGLFTNDSYTNVSNLLNFTVPEPPVLELADVTASGGKLQISLQTKTGRTYLVQRSQNLTDWENLGSAAGLGTLQTFEADPVNLTERSFFRILEQ
jgi:hypothetical protein